MRAAVGARGGGLGIERVVVSGPGQRVHPLLHDARGVRPPALRGRQDALRPLVLRRCSARSWRSSPGALVRGEPAPGRRTRSTRPTASRPTARPTAGRRRRARCSAQPGGLYGGFGRAASPGRAARRASTGRSTAPSSSSQRRGQARPLGARRRRPRPGDAVEGRRRGPLHGPWEIPLYAPRGAVPASWSPPSATGSTRGPSGWRTSDALKPLASSRPGARCVWHTRGRYASRTSPPGPPVPTAARSRFIVGGRRDHACAAARTDLCSASAGAAGPCRVRGRRPRPRRTTPSARREARWYSGRAACSAATRRAPPSAPATRSPGSRAPSST